MPGEQLPKKRPAALAALCPEPVDRAAPDEASNEVVFFSYGETEIAWLTARDPILGAAIEEIGPIRRPVIPDLFTALVQAMVGQQISAKALATVWGRLEDRFAPLAPERLGAVSAGELQSCGLSWRKVEYIRGMVASVLDGRLDLARLAALPDEEVRVHLCQIKGIGAWTAEMLLTFCLQRPDVMSPGDLAILRGLRMLYGHREITPRLFARYRRRYSPHATVASLYLWAIAGGACPRLTDRAPR